MVLVTGGCNFDDLCLARAELYDLATGTWSVTGSLNIARLVHTAALLANGEGLVAGGDRARTLASAELYEPGAAAPTANGRGAVDNQWNEVTFNFSATQVDDSSNLGYFSFCDPAAGVCATKGKIQSLSITGNTVDLNGQARLEDGSIVTFSVSVTDNGEPGTSDTISISLSTGYFVNGTLISGDVRIC